MIKKPETKHHKTHSWKKSYVKEDYLNEKNCENDLLSKSEKINGKLRFMNQKITRRRNFPDLS